MWRVWLKPPRSGSTTLTACLVIILETAAHGTVVTRAGFVRREVTTDMGDGKIPLLTGEPIAILAEADATGTDIGDLVWVDGRLHTVRSPLADGGGMLRLQLSLAQLKAVDLVEESVEVAVVGDPDGSFTVIALAPAGVLRRSHLVSIDGDAYRVGTPTDWPAGGLRRYLLTPA
jgi:hypothetical protein